MFDQGKSRVIQASFLYSLSIGLLGRGNRSLPCPSLGWHHLIAFAPGIDDILFERYVFRLDFAARRDAPRCFKLLAQCLKPSRFMVRA